MAKIIATCRLEDCSVTSGMILMGQSFDMVPIKYSGKNVNDMYHRECNPHSDHSRDGETMPSRSSDSGVTVNIREDAA